MLHDIYQTLEDLWSGPITGQTVAIGFVGLFFVAIGVSIWRDNLRAKALARIARELGLNFVPLCDDAGAARNGFLRSYVESPDSKVTNVIEGAFQTHAVCAFDYRYEAGGTGRHYQYSNFLALILPTSLPNLRIYPEDLVSKLGHLAGGRDIEFESAEFSGAFVVKCDDTDFARDLFQPDLIAYLLQHRELSLSIQDANLTMSFGGALSPRKLAFRLQQLVDIRNLFPEHLPSR